MVPPSYMRSVVDRNFVMRRMTIARPIGPQNLPKRCGSPVARVVRLPVDEFPARRTCPICYISKVYADISQFLRSANIQIPSCNRLLLICLRSFLQT
jgi:hypothetical protein